jgi:hypothetical protein
MQKAQKKHYDGSGGPAWIAGFEAGRTKAASEIKALNERIYQQAAAGKAVGDMFMREQERAVQAEIRIDEQLALLRSLPPVVEIECVFRDAGCAKRHVSVDEEAYAEAYDRVRAYLKKVDGGT